MDESYNSVCQLLTFRKADSYSRTDCNSKRREVDGRESSAAVAGGANYGQRKLAALESMHQLPAWRMLWTSVGPPDCRL